LVNNNITIKQEHGQYIAHGSTKANASSADDCCMYRCTRSTSEHTHASVHWLKRIRHLLCK
jgi:hypothetical protein